MASTSACGTGCAEPIAASAASRLARAALALAMLTGAIALEVAGLRSAKGLVQICLTGDAKHFPDCDRDPAAHRLSLPASTPLAIRFGGLAPGGYAIALFHDENGNGKLDTRFGIPTEGFGFSNNPRIRFGPPDFAAARIMIGGGEVRQVVKMRYLF